MALEFSPAMRRLRSTHRNSFCLRPRSERLRSIQNYLTQVLDAQAVQAKQLDHLDGMLHEVHQFIAEHKPALAKALSLLDPGQSVRKYWKARKGVETDGG